MSTDNKSGEREAVATMHKSATETLFSKGHVPGLMGFASEPLFSLSQLEAVERERDDLLNALGFNPGPLATARQVILQDAAGLRPAMVKARREAQEAKPTADLWNMFTHDGAPGMLPKLWSMVKEWENRATTAEAQVTSLQQQVAELRGALEEAATVAAQFVDGRLYKPKFPACSYHAGEIYDAVRAVTARSTLTREAPNE